MAIAATVPLARSDSAQVSPIAARQALSILTFDLVAVVTTQKIAIPLGGGESQIALAFVLHFGVLALLMTRRLVLVSRQRLLLWALFACLATTFQTRFTPEEFSFPSLVLMLMTSAILLFVVPLPYATYRELLRRFVLTAFAAAMIVGIDWIAQFAGRAMPDLEEIIPASMVYQAFNYIQPLQWGSPWMKPNGLFFLETSHVSQFIGMGLVIELALFRRLWMAGALVVALGATFGVTGILLVATSLPFLLARLPLRVIAVILVTSVVGIATLGQVGFLDGMLKRTDEFSQSSSSGFNRFILPLQWSLAGLNAPPDEAWFGTGAGSMPKAVNNEEDSTAGYAWPPYTKVGVEYGTLILAIWLLFVGASFFGGGIPVVVSWVAFFQFMFLNGSLNVPLHTIYCVLLCAGYVFVDHREPSFRLVRRGPALARIVRGNRLQIG